MNKPPILTDAHYLIKDAVKRHNEVLEEGGFWILLKSVKEAQRDDTFRETLKKMKEWEDGICTEHWGEIKSRTPVRRRCLECQEALNQLAEDKKK